MKFSMPIEIPGWEQIAEKYKSWVEFGKEGLHSKFIPMREWDFIHSIICPALKTRTGKDHQIYACINFFTRPHTSRGLHLDYNDPNWPTRENWALNIPIANYENSQMEWYTGEYTKETLVNPRGIIYDKLTWKTQPVLIETCSITSPTLVYVDVPHDVKNNGNNIRVLMSIRVTPNILTYDPTQENAVNDQ